MHGNETYTIMPTARIHILDKLGQKHECRALLDTGAQPHIITRKLCEQLGLSKTRGDIEITGIERGSLSVSWCTTAKIMSRVTNYSATITCIIMDKITDDIPNKCVRSTNIKLPDNVEMADPEYDYEGPIDLLLGASLFFKLLSIGQIIVQNSDLILQKTLLGWVIAGNALLSARRLRCNIVTNKMLDQRIENFWKIENCFTETPNIQQRRSEYAEEHFVNNISRDIDGRFVVSIPFKDNVLELGDSEQIAKSRLIQMERRLSKNETLK